MTEEQKAKRRHIWVIQLIRNGRVYYFKDFNEDGKARITENINEAYRNSYHYQNEYYWKFRGVSRVVKAE